LTHTVHTYFHAGHFATEPCSEICPSKTFCGVVSKIEKKFTKIVFEKLTSASWQTTHSEWRPRAVTSRGTEVDTVTSSSSSVNDGAVATFDSPDCFHSGTYQKQLISELSN